MAISTKPTRWLRVNGLQIEHREGGKDDQGDHLLHRLELCRAVDGGTITIGRNSQTILNEGNAPAHQNDNPQGPVGILQVAVPGERHEHVGQEKQGNRE